MPRITDFCSCIYVLGCKLSLVRLCDSDFEITPVDDITIGVTSADLCCHMAYISFASSWHLLCLLLLLLLLLLFVITRKQDIYNYMVEKKHVYTIYSIAAVLYFQFFGTCNFISHV